MGFRLAPGCCCGKETCKTPMRITALGCPGYGGGQGQWPLPNASVVITDLDGNTVASGQTDSQGEFPFANGVASRAYVCTVTAKRFNKLVKQFTFICGGFAEMNVCRDAGPKLGYACCQNFAYPLKTTLQYTDRNGTRSLQFVASSWGPGGDCAVGTWQLCYDAPATVSSGDCSSTFTGTTPVSVGYCPNPAMGWDVFGCGFQYPNQYLGCVAAATGAAFFPEVYYGALDCYTSPEGSSLVDCSSPWISCYGPRGAAGMTDLPVPYGGWSISLAPPDGFAGSGVWKDENGYTGAGLYGAVMQNCANPIGGPYTITE